ncbi:unnamed protein product [Adineta steineri]|uniref:Uncharacterized protein n=1 Tax=Adineta steineri TaxID=433720 RepID=A0A818RSV7_9BILA|nr:unnamed protein product [Adineta steineri]CAF3662703.1 unnamed protein product [Adineta steineri]
MDIEITSEKNDANSFAMDTVDQEKQSHEMEPTTEQLNSLQRISDHIPLAAWMIVVCEFCERFAFYGISGPFQNYIQFPVPGSNGTQPGALNRGHQTATLLTTFFSFFCYFTPIVGAIVADQFWGKYKAIFISCIIYSLGLSVLVVSSIPASINAGTALPGLIIAMIIIGMGAGGVKSNVSPLMAEQYTRKTLIVKEIKGKKKIIDPQITIQSLFNWFYWAINLGALSSILTVNVEKYHSFWLAYLIPLVIFIGAIIVLVVGRQRYIRAPPNGSLLVQAFRATRIAFRLRWKLGKQDHIKHILDYAKQAQTSDETTETNEKMNEFIDDLKQAIHACRVFAFYPIYWICFTQIVGNLTSQAAQMNVGPLPNDVLRKIEPLVLIIFIPIFEKVIYPSLRRLNINFKPILRITCGFIVVSLAMAWTAIVQHLIYSTGPNYSFTPKPCSKCQKFNNITVAWQIPTYFLIAISEIFASITGLEYAFTHAPTSMKSIVMSFFLFTSAIGSALNFTLIPVTVDPKLLWMYTSLSVVAFVTGIIFYVTFRNDDIDRNCVLPEETSTNPPKQADI